MSRRAHKQLDSVQLELQVANSGGKQKTEGRVTRARKAEQPQEGIGVDSGACCHKRREKGMRTGLNKGTVYHGRQGIVSDRLMEPDKVLKGGDAQM